VGEYIVRQKNISARWGIHEPVGGTEESEWIDIEASRKERVEWMGKRFRCGNIEVRGI
jgi:hypothetical protein